MSLFIQITMILASSVLTLYLGYSYIIIYPDVFTKLTVYQFA